MISAYAPSFNFVGVTIVVTVSCFAAAASVVASVVDVVGVVAYFSVAAELQLL